MTGFVGNTNSRTNDFCSLGVPTVEALVKLAETDAQWWSDLLWSSGGKLEPSKCNYHHIRYEFKPSGEPSLQKGTEFSRPINVADTEIKQMDNKQDHKSLGCYKGPSGKLAAQKDALAKKCSQYTSIVKFTPFNRMETSMFYLLIFLPSVGYCLETTYFEEHVLDKLQSGPLCAMLSEMGYNRNTARSIVFGPCRLGGIGLHRLYDNRVQYTALSHS
jgi:hypothetical protein